MTLDGLVRKIFSSYEKPTDLSGLSVLAREKLARYCIGKVLSEKEKQKAHEVLISLGWVALRYLFPALEKQQSQEFLSDIVVIAAKGDVEANQAAKYAVGALHNPLQRDKVKKVIASTTQYSLRFLIYALDDDSVSAFAASIIREIYSDGKCSDLIIDELRRAVNPENYYKPKVREMAETILSALPLNRNL